MWARIARWGLLLCLGLLLPVDLPAATLQLDGTGHVLLGATGVNVGGTLYDVTFVDGTCIAIFSGCDSGSDFPFHTEADALSAAQALLDQVFIGVFDSFTFPPTDTTFGCFNDTRCAALTPFAFGSLGALLTAAALNSLIESSDQVSINETNPSFDTSSDAVSVWVSWRASSSAPVPEPSTLGLLGAAALAAMLVRRKR